MAHIAIYRFLLITGLCYSVMAATIAPTTTTTMNSMLTSPMTLALIGVAGLALILFVLVIALCMCVKRYKRALRDNGLLPPKGTTPPSQNAIEKQQAKVVKEMGKLYDQQCAQQQYPQQVGPANMAMDPYQGSGMPGRWDQGRTWLNVPARSTAMSPASYTSPYSFATRVPVGGNQVNPSNAPQFTMHPTYGVYGR